MDDGRSFLSFCWYLKKYRTARRVGDVRPQFAVTLGKFAVSRIVFPDQFSREMLEEWPQHRDLRLSCSSRCAENAVFSVKFPVCREFARRRVRSALRRQPGVRPPQGRRPARPIHRVNARPPKTVSPNTQPDSAPAIMPDSSVPIVQPSPMVAPQPRRTPPAKPRAIWP